MVMQPGVHNWRSLGLLLTLGGGVQGKARSGPFGKVGLLRQAERATSLSCCRHKCVIMASCWGPGVVVHGWTELAP